MSKQEPKIESNINIPTGESPQDPEPEKIMKISTKYPMIKIIGI